MLAAVLGPAEVVTRRLYLAAASLGALAGAAAAAAGTQLWLQASVFAAVAAGGVATRQLLLKPYLRAVAREGRMAGTATVVDEVSDNAGWARYCGSRWAARTVGAVIQPGTKVVIAGLAADGSTLWVYPADAARQAAQARRAAPVQRVGWREASAARGKLTGGYLLTAEERLRLLQLSRSRWWYTDRLWSRAITGFIGVSCAGLLAVGALGFGPALRAARGEGTRGVFTAESLSCDQSCQWTGTFTTASHQLRPNVVYDDPLPPGTHPGSIVPALYPAGSDEVFAVHGSTTWRFYAVLMPVATAGLIGSLWLGPIRYLRRRAKRATASGRAATTPS